MLSKSLPATTAFVQTKAGELRSFIQSGGVQQTVRGWFGKKARRIKSLSNELVEKGIKHNPDKIMSIAKSSSGKIFWIEKGNSSAGLEHILFAHGEEFLQKGISTEQIPDFLVRAVTKGRVVGVQGNRPIYEVLYNGLKHRVSITVGNNGFIVGANLRSFERR